LRDAIALAIRESSARAVTFCGGEPLLVKKLFEYAEMQQDAGKMTVLNTNGELLLRRCATMRALPFDVVGISIDGPDEPTHRLMRGATADFRQTVRAAEWLRAEHLPVKRKIATVISAANRARIDDLGRLVARLQPDIWRLYQYSPWGPQNTGQTRHQITREVFDEVVRHATESAHPVEVRASSTDTTGGCLLVDPFGRIMQTDGLDYVEAGNCLHEPIEDIWHRLPEQSAVRTNKLWLRTL